MYELDGIVYAGEPYKLPRVVDVQSTSDHCLFLEFDNGVKKRFDFSPLLNSKAFAPLRDFTLFSKARVMHGTVIWSDEIDIAPEWLYDEGETL